MHLAWFGNKQFRADARVRGPSANALPHRVLFRRPRRAYRLVDPGAGPGELLQHSRSLLARPAPNQSWAQVTPPNRARLRDGSLEFEALRAPTLPRRKPKRQTGKRHARDGELAGIVLGGNVGIVIHATY